MKIYPLSSIGRSNYGARVKNSSAQLRPDEDKILNRPSYAFFNTVSFRGAIDFDLRKEVLDTVENDEPLSNEGFKGVAYKVEHNGEKYVAKIARSKDYSFDNEARVLKRVPQDLTSSQRFKDYFKSPDGRDILVSTFVDGRKGVLESREDFRKYFAVLSRLDSAGVLNGDLNMANCLFDKGNISIIDYGEGSLFRLGEGYEEMYPDFYAKSNVINLEHNGIPDCINSWHKNSLETKELFKTYLQEKADFYLNHASKLQKAARDDKEYQKFINYERNLASVLKNPSDEVVKNEARRIDILYTFEQADTGINYHKIPKEGIKIWNLTINKTKAALDNAAELLESKTLSPKERLYFKYQYKLYSQLYDTFKQWSKGTFEWLDSVMEKPVRDLSNHERTLRMNKNKETDFMPPDLYSYIING